MSTIPTVTNGGLLLYLAAALVLVFLAATYRPGRGIVLDAAHPHKNNPDAPIHQDRRAGAANPTPNKEQDMPKDTDAVQLNSDGTMPLTTNRLDDMPEPVFFATLAEARQYVVTALGDFGDDFDVDAITSAVFDYDTATDADGTVHLNRQGFRLAVTTEEFWQIVRDNERGQR